MSKDVRLCLDCNRKFYIDRENKEVVFVGAEERVTFRPISLINRCLDCFVAIDKSTS